MPFPQYCEKTACFAGFADNVGDAFCFKVVTADTEEVVYRPVLHSALDTANDNKRPSNLAPPCDSASVTLPPDRERVKNVRDLDHI